MTSTAPNTSAPLVTQRRPWLLVATIGAVVLAGVVWAMVSLLGGGMPRLNENAVVLTKFIRSSDFDSLPYEQQRQFYKVLDDRDEELDEAYRGKRLTESEYRAGLEAAWLGKHINRVEKYFSLPPGQARTAYLQKLLDKKDRKSLKPQDSADVDADETAAELKVEKWPSAVRQQWDQFHDAYRAERKAREKARAPQTKPGA
jgi:hypothetical protein